MIPLACSKLCNGYCLIENEMFPVALKSLPCTASFFSLHLDHFAVVNGFLVIPGMRVQRGLCNEQIKGCRIRE